MEFGHRSKTLEKDPQYCNEDILSRYVPKSKDATVVLMEEIQVVKCVDEKEEESGEFQSEAPCTVEFPEEDSESEKGRGKLLNLKWKLDW